MAVLALLDPDGEPVRFVELADRPLLVGRGHSNDLVVSDRSVSSRHAVFWASDEGVQVEDLGSRNGTWLGDERITTKRTLARGQVVRLGQTLWLRVQEQPPMVAQVELVDLEEDVAYPVRGDRFRIGTVSGCDLVLPGKAIPAVTVVLQPDGGMGLGLDGRLKDLRPGEEFVVGGRRFCLRAAQRTEGVTLELSPSAYPYAIKAARQGPLVVIEGPGDLPRIELQEDNRAVLLFVLAERAYQDFNSGESLGTLGWIDDQDVCTAIWGRTEGDRQVRHLNVLIWRVRKVLEEGGYDPWFIEKRNRKLRVRLPDIQLDDA